MTPQEYSLKGAVPDPFQYFHFLNTGSAALPAHVGKAALIGVFLVFFIFYITVSVVLFYHWQKYGMRNSMIIGAEILFSVVSIFLFAAAFLSI